MLVRYPCLVSWGVLFAGLVFFSWCAAPVMVAYFFADDFYLLAVARWMGNPFAAFGDHFAEGELYRPLGLLSWQAAFAMFGSDAGGHYALNLLLHGFNGILVFVLLNSMFRVKIMNAVLAVLFLLHPATLSTMGWLAARFDLLATAFVIGTLYSARRYLLAGDLGWLVAAILTAILAILSKETGYIVLPIAFLALLGWRRLPMFRLIHLIVAETLIAGTFLEIRFSILTHASNGLFEQVVVGFSDWLGVLVANLTYYEIIRRYLISDLFPFVVISATLIALPIYCSVESRLLKHEVGPTGNVPPVAVVEALLVGIAIIICTGIIQARNAILLPVPNSTDLLAAFLSSRFFYLPTFGLVLAVSGLVHALNESKLVALRNAGILLVGVLLLVSGNYGALGRGILERWRDGTNVHRVLIEDAVQTAERHFAHNPGLPLILQNTSMFSWYFPQYVSYIMFALLPAADVANSALIVTEKLPANIPFAGVNGADSVARKGWRSPKIVGNISFYYPGEDWMVFDQATRMTYRNDGANHGFY